MLDVLYIVFREIIFNILQKDLWSILSLLFWNLFYI